MDSLSEFYKVFPPWQQTKIWGKQDLHVEGGPFSMMSSYFLNDRDFMFVKALCAFFQTLLMWLNKKK